MVVIQNGYDFSMFYPNAEARKRVRYELNIHGNIFLMGMVARFEPYKNHQILLEALVLLKAKMPFQCVLVGSETSERRRIANEIFRMGLENHVKIIDYRYDVQNIMNALDLHALSSTSEGFPNVLAEAMACGVPAVSTDAGDARDILGNDTMCCPPCNPLALADLIMCQKKEWENPIRWNEKKAACTQRNRRFFAIESMMEKYVSTWFPLQEGA